MEQKTCTILVSDHSLLFPNQNNKVKKQHARNFQACPQRVHSEQMQVIWRTHFTHPPILNSSAVFIFIRGLDDLWSAQPFIIA